MKTLNHRASQKLFFRATIRFGLIVMLFVFFLPLVPKAHSAEKDKEKSREIEFFESKIRPVLVEKCHSCHSQDAAKRRKLKGKLLVDSRAGLLAGGESGPAIVAGEPGKSLLLEALRHESIQMPPKEKLPKRIIDDFAKWIAMGAPDPRDGKKVDLRSLDLEAGRKHWAFQPLSNPLPPRLPNDNWSRNEIDRFVWAKLVSKKLKPSPAADRRTFIRRANFAVLGLPPTPQQVKEFIAQSSDSAHEALIDDLLKQPQYGERWARHWLDVARFGESEGSNPEEDRIRRNAYKFRDAVIKSLNEDMSYNEFVAYQLSGRGIENNSPLAADLSQFVDLGTRLQRNTHPNDKKFHILDDMVATMGNAFLGVTIGCARCHDHKIDPISSEEYYRLTAVFFDRANVSDKVGANNIPTISEPHVLGGGSWQRPLKKVDPGFVEVLMRNNYRSEHWLESDKENDSKSNKLPPRESLAHWITDVEKGAGALLSRVIVNRIWQHHFGRGLVTTPNDFGNLGARPSHPELLDWLATELIRQDWKLKSIHRLILTSATFRQASSDRWAEVDRDNEWMWHYRSHRLEAESIRDNILSVSGALRNSMYGPSIQIGTSRQPYVEKPEHWRRSIYLSAPRFETHPVLRIFDPAGTIKSQGKRTVSTTPSSALFMFNASFLWGQAELLAKRVRDEAGDSPAKQIELLYEITLSRPPSSAERDLGLEFLSTPDDSAENNRSPLIQYCHTLMCLNEFIYVR